MFDSTMCALTTSISNVLGFGIKRAPELIIDGALAVIRTVGVAQLVAHLLCTQRVRGSIPLVSTNAMGVRIFMVFRAPIALS